MNGFVRSLLHIGNKPEAKTYLNDKLNLRLSKQHKLKLRGLAQEEKISISELIRRILKTKIHIKS